MIKNFKDLERLIKLCRKQGITEVKYGAVELKLGHMPIEHTTEDEPTKDPANPYANFPKGELTPEQLIFYSSGGAPEDDPFKEAQ